MSVQSSVNGNVTVAPPIGDSSVGGGGTGAAFVIWTLSVGDGRLRTPPADTATMR